MFAADVRDDALMEVVGQMHGLTCAAQRQLLAAVVELDQGEAWRVDAASSMAAWLAMRLGLSHQTALEWLRVARGLVFTPTVAETFGNGELSWDQLRAAIDLVAHGGLDEAEVAADAVGKTAAELDRLAREARRVSREESNTLHAAEYLRLRWDRRGFLHVHGRLSSDRGARVERAIMRLAEKQAIEQEGRFRSLDSRAADALHDLATASIAQDADPDRATIVLHIDAHALAGAPDGLDLASLELGPLVSLATAHRLSCDGRCQVVVDDLFGRTVEVARTKHAIPRWLRRRVLRRDGGCRWPGCARTALLHVHHMVHFGHGGPTIEDNALALCWFHHRAMHEGGWNVEGDPRGRLVFRGPRGRVLQAGPPRLRGDVRDELGLSRSGDPPPTAA